MSAAAVEYPCDDAPNLLEVTAYAIAGIPVHVVADRRDRRVHVLTEPEYGEYRVHAVHPPGESFTLPESVGVPAELEVDRVLGLG